MSDSITILKTLGPLMTKVWSSEGISDYGSAKNFKVTHLPVSGIEELSQILSQLETQPKACVIRGAQEAPSEEPVQRLNANFLEVPHHWFLVDIDRYQPVLADPVLEPVAAIEEFILGSMPEEFHGASYHWQLSSSAGAAKNRDTLKAHVWFWSETAYTGPQLDAWARVNSVPLDKAVLRRVQVHYTAAPVFDAGVADPVPVRSGYVEGLLGDEVPLQIEDHVLGLAREYDGGADDLELVDPTQKPGLIGAFCSAYNIDRVIDEILPDEFVKVTDRRVTWLNGGGSPEGVFITPCGNYAVNTHNTDGLDNRATNAWDLVRHYKFGHLDSGLTAFEKLSVRDLPSQAAMYEWAKTLGLEVAGGEALTPVSRLDELRAAVTNAADFETLRDTVCSGIAQDIGIDPVTREILAQAVKERCIDLGSRLPIAMCRDLVRPQTRAAGAPNWLEGWVYVTDEDKFFNVNTKRRVSVQGFNAMFNREIGGDDVNAARTALDDWDMPNVQRTAYVPWLGSLFDMGDVPCANSYRPESMPVVVPHDGSRAVCLVEQHVRTLLGDSANTFIQWMAHNVQHPGRKIRWAYIIKGIPGDGKSLLGTVMGQVMGAENTIVISPRVLGTDFNGWAEGHCVGICEEMREVGHSRHDNMNAMKPNITNDTIPIHRKGRDEYNIINTTNYVIFTNYADALPLDEGDRRFAVVFSPFDNKEQIEEKFGAEYFAELHDAIHNEPGELRSWLLSVDLAGFDPNGPAPMTADKESMIAMAKTDEELLAEEVIREGAVGVTFEVLSSGHLTAAMRAKSDEFLRTTQVARLLVKLGYTQRGTPVWWNGKTCRVWTKASARANTTESIKKALDLTTSCKDFDVL
jgi:hypothetical protein